MKKASDEYETLLLGELTRRRHPRSSWSFQEQFKIIKIKITQVALMSKNGEFWIKFFFFEKKIRKKFLKKKMTKTKIKFWINCLKQIQIWNYPPCLWRFLCGVTTINQVWLVIDCTKLMSHTNDSSIWYIAMILTFF